MEEAAELADYLPLAVMSRRDSIPWDKTPKEQEYIQFLWAAFETNHTHGKYQFAFLAYHMLTMSFVYFNIWQIKQTTPKDFAMGLIGFGKDIEKSLLDATSPFVFGTVNERSILRFLKLIGCDNAKIGTYVKLVDDRNESAHPNGYIFYSTEAALDIKTPKSCAWWRRLKPTRSRLSRTATAISCCRITTPTSASMPMPPTRSAKC